MFEGRERVFFRSLQSFNVRLFLEFVGILLWRKPSDKQQTTMVDQPLNNSTTATPVTTTLASNIAVKMTQDHGHLVDPLTLSHVGDGIFLQSKTAQIMAGAFVWMALFITCQQVSWFFYVFSFFDRYRLICFVVLRLEWVCVCVCLTWQTVVMMLLH